MRGWWLSCCPTPADGDARRPVDLRSCAGGSWAAARLANAAGARLRLDAAALAAALADLADPASSAELPMHGRCLGPRRASLAGSSTHIAASIEPPGCRRSAGRSPADIARRLIEQGRTAQRRPVARGACSAEAPFWRSTCRSTARRRRCERLPRQAGLALGAALGRNSPRAPNGDRGRRACRPPTIRYDAAFGRPLDYYTGLVFEISARR